MAAYLQSTVLSSTEDMGERPDEDVTAVALSYASCGRPDAYRPCKSDLTGSNPRAGLNNKVYKSFCVYCFV